MPTVNTLVVERADLLGLGQMHQLRGRVGRSGQRAYAYLFHPAEARSDRGGLRAAEDDRRGHRARQRVQDRHARPGDPRRRQPARRGAERATSPRSATTSTARWSPRPSAEMKGEPVKQPAEIKLDVPTDAFLPAGLRRPRRSCAWRPTAGWPASPRRPRSTTSAPSGRTATARCPAPAEALLDVGCLRAECHRLGLRDLPIPSQPGPPGADRAEDQRGDAPAPARPRRDRQGRPQAARRADQARRQPGASTSSASSASWCPSGVTLGQSARR